MKFDENEDIDEPIRAKSIVPPMRKGSKAIRFRIFTLLAMLLLVIIAMIEAGKPERWEWMGFAKAEPSVVKKSANNPDSKSDSNPAANVKVKPSNNQLDTTNDNHSSSERTSDTRDEASANIANFAPNLSAFLLTPGQEQEAYPQAAADFWRSLVNKMNPAQQKLLMNLLHSLRHHAPLEQTQQSLSKALVNVIKKKREEFHRDAFDQVALSTEGSEEKKNLSEQLMLSQDIWEKKILPSLNSRIIGDDITLSQLQAVHRLQKTLDQIMMDQVSDETALGWSGDTEAWKRIWENVAGVAKGEVDPEYETVTRIQLMSQPEYYRGKPVKIAGWVRAGKHVITKKESSIGFSGYYELWVRPKESKLGPFCVFVTELPNGFPELNEQLKEINEQVEIGAYFFKIRTYVSGDETVRNAPTLVGASLTPIAPVEYTSVSNWQPSWATLIFFFIAIPIIATAIAVWVYSISKTKPYEPGKAMANKINKSLQGLATNPMIQSDKEKIMELYDTDLSNESATE